MTQLSFEAGNRFPLLDLLPSSKPSRGGGNASEPFDSHLNRASTPSADPTSYSASADSPASRSASFASSASSAAQPVAADSPDPDRASSSSDAPTSTRQSESETSDRDKHSTASTSKASDASRVQAKKKDSDSEKDRDDKDDVEISQESAALVQQGDAVIAPATAKEESEKGGNVTNGIEKSATSQDKTSKKGEDDASAATATKQGNQNRPATIPGDETSKSGTSAAASEAATNAVAAEDQKIEPTGAVGETGDKGTANGAKDPLAKESSQDSSENPQATNQVPTKVELAGSPIEESTDVVLVNSNQKDETASASAARDKKSGQADKTEATNEAVNAAKQADGADAAERAAQQAQQQQTELAAAGELSLVTNSDSDPSNDQSQGGDADKSPVPGLTSNASNKPNVGSNSTPENSFSSKLLVSANEAPGERTGHAASAPAGTASGVSDSDSMSAADRARFVHRVSRALHIAHERGGEVRLRLSPPELGNLTLELKLHDKAMTANIEAETSAARTLLLDNLHVLKDRLAAQDIHVERFDVELRDPSQQQSPGGQSQDSDAGRHLRRVPNKPMTSGNKMDEPRTTSSPRPNSGSGQLNVII
jgi:flagellar hook-length control protein FliK